MTTAIVVAELVTLTRDELGLPSDAPMLVCKGAHSLVPMASPVTVDDCKFLAGRRGALGAVIHGTGCALSLSIAAAIDGGSGPFSPGRCRRLEAGGSFELLGWLS